MFVPFEALPDTARVWVYQSLTPIPADEMEAINAALHQFIIDWTSHNRVLHAWGGVWMDRFVVLAVDESKADASGCSLDKATHFVQHLESSYKLNLHERMAFAIALEDRVEVLSAAAFSSRFQNNELTHDSWVFDTLVNTKEKLLHQFKKPIKDSWHRRFV